MTIVHPIILIDRRVQRRLRYKETQKAKEILENLFMTHEICTHFTEIHSTEYRADKFSQIFLPNAHCDTAVLRAHTVYIRMQRVLTLFRKRILVIYGVFPIFPCDAARRR